MMNESAIDRIGDLSAGQRAHLAAALRSREGAQPDKRPAYDVAVIGGGVAGLSFALELVLERPGTKVLVVERAAHPVPEAAHKVGESTVEIAAHYLRDILGMGQHLEEEQIRKFGLRMFFSDEDNTDITRRVELGSSVFPPLHTYQLDRGRLENELARRCASAGVEFLDDASVADVETRGETTRLTVQSRGGERRIEASWLVDASGRAQVLRRQAGKRPVSAGHRASAAWLRVGHPIDVGTWTQTPASADWCTRVEGDRSMSTIHLMGEGYWVWLIRLASGSTSVGIVADDDHHDFGEFNTLDRALRWLAVHEPQCARAIEQHRSQVQDFRVMRDYSYGCDQVFTASASERWCLTGESGLFLDPLYSPGLDLIAISNGLVVDLVTRSLDGGDVQGLAIIHDRLFRSVTDIWLSIYRHQYQLMGNAQVMSSKVIWDTAFYWGVFGLMFFNNKFRTAATTPSIAADLARLTNTSNRVQQFFREWAAIDNSMPDGRFVDLYSPLNFMVELHAGMADQLDDVQFQVRFTENADLFEQLAGQLMTSVIDVSATRVSSDAVTAQIQSWQLDPSIGRLVSAYRRRRRQRPTSAGWTATRPTASPGLFSTSQPGPREDGTDVPQLHEHSEGNLPDGLENDEHSPRDVTYA